MQADADRYVQAVRQYADKVLQVGRDTHGPKHTPLLVDGVDVQTYEPVRWKYRDLEWIPANLANHQTLFRTLAGLTELTGEPSYKQAAVDAMKYGMDNLRSPSGLLYWGGHTTYDVLSDDWAGRHRLKKNPTPYHEFMHHLPYYDLMNQIDPAYTHQFLEALWSGHIVEWERLDADRHAHLWETLPPVDWNRPYDGGPVFYTSVGRSFAPVCCDLIYAAATLYRYEGNAQALVWAKRLAHRFVESADPKTHLRANIYNHKEDPDRAHTQFGDAVPGHVVSEATMWSPHTCIQSDIVWMTVGRQLGAEGTDLIQWALDDLRAIATVGYDPQRKVFQGLLIDGTNVEKVLKTRSGYFGAAGTPISGPTGVDPQTFRAYALASQISGEAFFWDQAREFATVRGLGDIGATCGAQPALSETNSVSPDEIVGLIYLYHQSGRAELLTQAGRIADNILRVKLVNGLFVAEPGLKYTRLDSHDALVLLQLAAVIGGKEEAVPPCVFGASYFACEWIDSPNYVYDFKLYHTPRDEAPASAPATESAQGD